MEKAEKQISVRALASEAMALRRVKGMITESSFAVQLRSPTCVPVQSNLFKSVRDFAKYLQILEQRVYFEIEFCGSLWRALFVIMRELTVLVQYWV